MRVFLNLYRSPVSIRRPLDVEGETACLSITEFRVDTSKEDSVLVLTRLNSDHRRTSLLGLRIKMLRSKNLAAPFAEIMRNGNVALTNRILGLDQGTLW